MATVHTDVTSKHEGERQIAKQLGSIPDDNLHLWFGLDYIPGVRDIDVLAVHQHIGIFVIEVKAVPIKMIKRIGYQTCHIEGRSPDRGPTVQAFEAMRSLQDFLRPRLRQIPFIAPTACWSKIHRHEWNSQMDNEDIVGDWAERLLFKDDIYS